MEKKSPTSCGFPMQLIIKSMEECFRVGSSATYSVCTVVLLRHVSAWTGAGLFPDLRAIFQKTCFCATPHPAFHGASNKF